MTRTGPVFETASTNHLPVDSSAGESDDSQVDGGTETSVETNSDSDSSAKATVSFSDLAKAAYCPRQLYHVRQEDERKIPEAVTDRIELAFEYASLIAASDRVLDEQPIDLDSGDYRRNLQRLREREYWDRLVDPDQTRALLTGKDARGIAHKIIFKQSNADDSRPTTANSDADTAGTDGDAGIPTIVSPGSPPEEGVWHHHRVRAVAAAKAHSWETKTAVSTAFVEYPAYAIVRPVRLTTRAKAAYRQTLRSVRAIDGPPPRANDSRCDDCAYREECGVETRSLRSLFGL